MANFVRSLSLVLLSGAVLATAAPLGDCPRRHKRDAQAGDFFGNEPQAGTDLSTDGFFGNGRSDRPNDSQLETGVFGDFFGEGLQGQGDFGDFFAGKEGQVLTEGNPKAGVGLVLVSIGTVSAAELAAITGSISPAPIGNAPQAPPPAASAPAPPAATPSGLTFVPTKTGVGALELGFKTVTTSINFAAISSSIAANQPQPSATDRPEQQPSSGFEVQSSARPSSVSAAPGASSASSANPAGTSLTFVPTVTGIAAIELGFHTTTTSINFGALSSSISAAASATSAQAANEQQSSVQIPGQKLSILPIGLGVFGGLALLALIVVLYVTYERRKYRGQFRKRRAAEFVKNALNRRQSQRVV